MRGGANSWYFSAVDYSFGHSIVQEATEVVRAHGGKVLGSAFYPYPGTTDFSSYLLQAQASGAGVIALGNAGNDLINSLKQIVEFGLKKPETKIVAMLAFISDIHAAGLAIAAGTVLPATFYWDQNDRTRAFTERLLVRPHGCGFIRYCDRRMEPGLRESMQWPGPQACQLFRARGRLGRA